MKKIKFFDFLLLIYFLTLMSCVIILRRIDSFQSHFVTTETGNLFSMLIFSVLSIVCLFIILNKTSKFKAALYRNKHLLLLHFLLIVSVLWSFIPVQTLVSSIKALVFYLAIICFFSLPESQEKYIEILCKSLFILLFLCLIVILFFPNIGLFFDNVWRGIFFSKNGFASFIVFLQITLIYLYKKRSISFVLCSITSLLFLFFILQANSATSIILYIAIIFITLLISLISKRNDANLSLAFLLIGIFIPMFIFSLYSIEYILNFLGRDITLTGRTMLWSNIINVLKENYLLGYGYWTFWEGINALQYDMLHFMRWRTISAHNSYLHAMLDVGLVGVFLLIYISLKSVYLSLHFYLNTKDPKFLLVFLLIMKVFLGSFTDNTFIDWRLLNWLVFLSAVIYLNIEVCHYLPAKQSVQNHSKHCVK